MKRAPSPQSGFSLVELMIAMAIGLIIIGAILQTFVMNNRSIEAQRTAIALQEQGRATVDYISRYARLAGFREDSLTSSVLSNAISGSGTGVTFRFRGENAADTTTPLRDCRGDVVSAGSISVNNFSINGGTLYCNATDATLIDNVHDSLFLFGEDTDNDGSPNLYRTAAQVSDWEQVVALKLCLVLESSNNLLDVSAAIPDVMCDGSDSAATRKLLRKVETTIALRNRTGG